MRRIISHVIGESRGAIHNLHEPHRARGPRSRELPIDRFGRPPSGPRSAWNAGEKLGLRGCATLLPLLVWIAAMGGWVGWGMRKEKLLFIKP
jgi:hypothetical protein